MQTRQRLVLSAAGLCLVAGPALALAAPAGAAPTPSAPVPAASVSSMPPPSAVPSSVAPRVPAPVTATPGPTAQLPTVSVAPGNGLDVPAGKVDVTRQASGPSSTGVLALGGAGVLLLAAGTTVAVRRRS